MKKRVINFSILIFGTLFVYFAVTGIFDMECLFKRLFHISCPGCGITRCFRAILNLDFINAFKYNIMGTPLFIFGTIYAFLLINDIIFNDNKGNRIVFCLLKKYYVVIIFLLGLTIVINNINGI